MNIIQSQVRPNQGAQAAAYSLCPALASSPARGPALTILYV